MGSQRGRARCRRRHGAHRGHLQQLELVLHAASVEELHAGGLADDWLVADDAVPLGDDRAAWPPPLRVQAIAVPEVREVGGDAGAHPLPELSLEGGRRTPNVNSAPITQRGGPESSLHELHPLFVWTLGWKEIWTPKGKPLWPAALSAKDELSS